MGQRYFLLVLFSISALVLTAGTGTSQEPDSNVTVVHINVNMVQLDVAVTDKKGRYVTGLGPANFQV